MIVLEFGGYIVKRSQRVSSMLSIVWGCVEMCYTLLVCDKVNINGVICL